MLSVITLNFQSGSCGLENSLRLRDCHRDFEIVSRHKNLLLSVWTWAHVSTPSEKHCLSPFPSPHRTHTHTHTHTHTPHTHTPNTHTHTHTHTPSTGLTNSLGLYFISSSLISSVTRTKSTFISVLNPRLCHQEESVLRKPWPRPAHIWYSGEIMGLNPPQLVTWKADTQILNPDILQTTCACLPTTFSADESPHTRAQCSASGQSCFKHTIQNFFQSEVRLFTCGLL